MPWAMCTKPSRPITSANQPMATRPACELRSGWRRYRQDSRTASTGVSHATDPAAPWTNAETDRPAGLPIRHQMLAASTMAIPSQSSPIPSRRCSGSRSRALRPNRRAVKPTIRAAVIHAAARTRATRWNRALTGSRTGGRRPLPESRPRPPPAARPPWEPPRRPAWTLTPGVTRHGPGRSGYCASGPPAPAPRGRRWSVPHATARPAWQRV